MNKNAASLKEQLLASYGRAWQAHVAQHCVASDGKQLNAIARVLDANAFTRICDLSLAEPPEAWACAGRLHVCEYRFLEEIISREKLKEAARKKPRAVVRPAVSQSSRSRSPPRCSDAVVAEPQPGFVVANAALVELLN